MSEVNGSETEQTTQVVEQSEATAAAAAFATARSDEPAPAVETPEPEVTAEPEPAPEPKRFAGRTEEEIEALLGEIPSMKEGYRKQIDNLAGNYGKLNAAFQRLQQETPKGEAVTVTDEDLADMTTEFPELAGMTKIALNNVLKRINLRGASIDPEVIDQRVNSLVKNVVATERVALHEELLDGMTPGWREIVGMPDPEKVKELVSQGKPHAEAFKELTPQTDYRKWLATQPAEYQQKLLNSNSAFEIGNSVKVFKEATEAAAKKQSQNKQRLANAVQPTGSTSAPRSAISEQQAAEAAFRAQRGR